MFAALARAFLSFTPLGNFFAPFYYPHSIPSSLSDRLRGPWNPPIFSAYSFINLHLQGGAFVSWGKCKGMNL